MVLFLSLVSCTRSSGSAAPAHILEASAGVTYYDILDAVPIAILQTGEYPLWFRLTEEKPVHIGTIEDAIETAAFVPWPYAPHIRFLQKDNDDLIMIINRIGFLKITLNMNSETGLQEFAVFCFSGGEFWRQYTAGGFVFYEDKPAALIYLEDRFMETTLPKPRPQVWSFNMESNNLFPVEIPVFKLFPEDDGWSFDTLRKGNDGLFYYRVAKRNSSSASVKMFRAENLTEQGAEISIDVFYNSAPRKGEISHPSLPHLPKGFVYTDITEIGDSIFVSWEEQQDYSIGAAGFMLIRKIH